MSVPNTVSRPLPQPALAAFLSRIARAAVRTSMGIDNGNLYYLACVWTVVGRKARSASRPRHDAPFYSFRGGETRLLRGNAAETFGTWEEGDSTMRQPFNGMIDDGGPGSSLTSHHFPLSKTDGGEVHAQAIHEARSVCRTQGGEVECQWMDFRSRVQLGRAENEVRFEERGSQSSLGLPLRPERVSQEDIRLKEAESVRVFSLVG
nr:hypothetical protein CFP56_43943 [Quercus suber]